LLNVTRFSKSRHRDTDELLGTNGDGLLAVKREEESYAHTSFILAGRLIVRPRALLDLNIHDALPRVYDYWMDFMIPQIATVPLEDRLPWYKV